MTNSDLGVRVDCRHPREIVAIAKSVREICGIPITAKTFDIHLLLDSLSISELGFNYHVVPDKEYQLMFDADSESFCNGHDIIIKESVLEDAGSSLIYSPVNLEGRGKSTRARFTIGHEIGHFMLHRNQLDALRRTALPPTGRHNSSEQQANLFAGSLFVSEAVLDDFYVRGELTAPNLAYRCGISFACARVTKHRYMEARKKSSN